MGRLLRFKRNRSQSFHGRDLQRPKVKLRHNLLGAVRQLERLQVKRAGRKPVNKEDGQASSRLRCRRN